MLSHGEFLNGAAPSAREAAGLAPDAVEDEEPGADEVDERGLRVSPLPLPELDAVAAATSESDFESEAEADTGVEVDKVVLVDVPSSFPCPLPVELGAAVPALLAAVFVVEEVANSAAAVPALAVVVDVGPSAQKLIH